ncbi:hypothetical protein [Nocardia barduliensis]|uniref:hypothetical protein n=1 Tax=Nocardia barduliensis TaxID=2736643 RepID=UPI001573114C|nr:hypothetical protein [Nocardia barduliensis]
MMRTPMIQSPPTAAGGRPEALGLVRDEVSGVHAARHAAEVQRHAHRLGYLHKYTVRPPARVTDPIGYALAVAAGLGVQALVVFDLIHVDNQPALICDAGFDLETVCPGTTWARSARTVPGVEKAAV